ncbi:bifunctional diguanylate cyclase/phosphodiesterase [Deinococcus sp. QL22]|uniref:putative bifunctional diguanylate cyclase/phosphodiesterase n=1 Tax=Deinococcus sp. QL22 TaxID=2939437 RepID=UPI00201818E8|nr:EAL domain-containing protein [Deinococcus sp. QL22]UQN09597.1 EAL domain-containing protein [Deinococcus sp. QL22]
MSVPATLPDWALLLSSLPQAALAPWLVLCAQVGQAQAAGLRLSAGEVVWESATPNRPSTAAQRRYNFAFGELSGELSLWEPSNAPEPAEPLRPEAVAAVASLVGHLLHVSSALLDFSDPLPPPAAALDQFRDGVAVLDAGAVSGGGATDEPGPRVLYVNPELLHQTGFTAGELLGQPWWSLLGPETTPQTLGRLRGAVEQGRSVRIEVPQQHQDGRTVWAELSLTPVRAERGDLTHWLAHWRAARPNLVPDARTSDSPDAEWAQVWELAAKNAPLVEVLARLVSSVERQFGGRRAVIVLSEEPPTVLTAQGEASKSGGQLFGLQANETQWIQPISSSTGQQLGTLLVQAQGGPDADTRAKLEAAAGLAALVIERSASQAVLERLALHDALTGLPNRVLFGRELERAVAEGQEGDGVGRSLIGVALMDLDRFKTINDTLGHSVGDALLQQVALRLRGALEPGDLLARMGGDEFLLLMGRSATPQQVQQVAGRLLHTFSQPFVLAGREIFMQPSLGFSVLPRRSADTERLIQQADTAMYQAKRQGGGYALYRLGTGESLTAMTLESGLHRALERQEFRLDYQPQLDTRTGELVGAEALLRWQHPELGLILPGEFIPLAEVTGLIVPIGAWVLRQGCLQAAAWVAQMPHLRMAVNLSARQFQQPDLIDTVTRALTAAGLDAQHLELELTESMLVQAQDAKITLERLKDLGVRVVVDDFGTGYSNLAYLKQYPIDALKINATFTDKVGGDLSTAIRDEVLVKAVMNLAHALDLAVTVEGVERPEQLDFLRRHNCDYVQGYLLGPPQEAGRLMEMFPELAGPGVPEELV